MKCKCGNFYDERKRACPECDANNPINVFKDAGLNPITFEKLSDDRYKAKMILKYGAGTKKHFKAIDECWDRQKCVDGINLMLAMRFPENLVDLTAGGILDAMSGAMSEKLKLDMSEEKKQ